MYSRMRLGSAYGSNPSAGLPLSSHTPFSVPADAPNTKSNASVSPSSWTAMTMPADTAPRIPPPSMASASRAPSSRSPVSARRRNSSMTGCAAFTPAKPARPGGPPGSRPAAA